jgi:hypothetical protein
LHTTSASTHSCPKYSSTRIPSVDHLDQALLTAPPGASGPEKFDPTALYLGYLDLATTPECFASDFARDTLAVLRYSARNNGILSTHYVIPLAICGSSTVTAGTAVCLLHRPTILILLVLFASNTLPNTTVTNHAIAAAIAAFQFNTRTREAGAARIDDPVHQHGR